MRTALLRGGCGRQHVNDFINKKEVAKALISSTLPYQNWLPPKQEAVDESFTFTQKQVAQFKEEGYLIVPKFIEPEVAIRLRDRFPHLFRGEFDTGIYPDEWHWREGIGRDDVTREIVNAWKSDRTIAKAVLAASLGRAMASLMSWDGARIAQDDIWWKPPGTKAITFHQDAPYFNFLEPEGEVITCWIALDDTTREAGTLEYIPGSHKWAQGGQMFTTSFFTAEDYKKPLNIAAANAQHPISTPQSIPVEVPIGGAAFHIGGMWHGSGPNNSLTQKIRRSLAIHAIPHNAKFKQDNVGYIYGRYKRFDSTEMDESFFPITWTKDGHRSRSIAHFFESNRSFNV